MGPENLFHYTDGSMIRICDAKIGMYLEIFCTNIDISRLVTEIADFEGARK